MANTKTWVSLRAGLVHQLEGVHSRDTALEIVKVGLEREAQGIAEELEALNSGRGNVSAWRGQKKVPLKQVGLTGCRWCGREEQGHGEQYTESVGSHAWTEPTDQQLATRTAEAH